MANKNKIHKPDSPEVSASAFGRIQLLLRKPTLKRPGYTQAWIKEKLGTGPMGRSRLDFVERLREVLT